MLVTAPTSKELDQLHDLLDPIPSSFMGKSANHIATMMHSHQPWMDRRFPAQSQWEKTLGDHAVNVNPNLDREDIRSLRLHITSRGETVRWWLNSAVSIFFPPRTCALSFACSLINSHNTNEYAIAITNRSSIILQWWS
jgi:hypothetical protein